jgi:hypothetical protein
MECFYINHNTQEQDMIIRQYVDEAKEMLNVSDFMKNSSLIHTIKLIKK